MDNDETVDPTRCRKYRAAIAAARMRGALNGDRTEMARAAIRLADAEQAELRAEVERLRDAQAARAGTLHDANNAVRDLRRALADERAESAKLADRVARVDLTRLVREMHEHLGAHINYGPPSTDIPDALRDIRIALLDEEVNEYREAALAGDLVGIADGLADLVYVAYGTAHTYGIPLDDVLVEVHRSNMTKTRNPDGGKFIKGPDFSRADVAGVIRAALAGTDTEATAGDA